jgi:hypothetical protein
MEDNNINYDDLFCQVTALKKVLLVVGGGRVGSDFFQSLLDGHYQILQVTGACFLHHWWKEAKCKDKLSDLIDEFIWYTRFPSNHIAKFKSYYNKQERWDQLGINKDDFFEVDINSFKVYMLNILANKELNSRNFILAVHLAYGLATGVDIKKTKILFYHAHQIEQLKDFRDDFPDFDVVCSIRELRNALVSSVDHWKKYDILNTYNMKSFYYFINRIFNGAEPLSQYTKNFKSLKLEDLHLFSKEVLEEFCKMYSLEFQNSMFESSYQGKKWWGDLLSGKYLDGFNDNIKNKKWKNRLFSYDNFLIEFILEERLKHYGYPIENKLSRFHLIPAFFLAFLPMKYELEIFKFSLTNKAQKRALFLICENLLFYLLRVSLYLKLIGKKINRKTFLANFFTQKQSLKRRSIKGTVDKAFQQQEVVSNN